MQKTQWTTFLWDVFICALGSYGGPEAHYGVFSQILVERKKYLTEEDLSELIGIYSLVPGPGSTQTITAIGHLVGGPILAWQTFMVWVLPAIAIMALIGFFYPYFSQRPMDASVNLPSSRSSGLHYLCGYSAVL